MVRTQRHPPGSIRDLLGGRAPCRRRDGLEAHAPHGRSKSSATSMPDGAPSARPCRFDRIDEADGLLGKAIDHLTLC